MATLRFKGEAEIEYTPPGDSPIIHLLAVPLLIKPQAFGFARRRMRWESWQADGLAREVFVLASDVGDEITGVVRFDDEPLSLLAMMRAGLEDNVTLTYRLRDRSLEFDCLLVGLDGAGPGEIVLQPDPEYFAFKTWSVGLILRNVDGQTFEALL